jgi:polar amino acid transport system substrate-binding protein
MKRTIRTLLLFAIAAASVVLSAQGTRLRLVSTEWPPFTNEFGRPRFALDLVEAAFERIGVTAATDIVAPADFTPSLLKGAFDGSGAAWKDAEREKVLLFSQPYLENRLVLIGRKGADVSASTFAPLKGRKIALVEGYAYGDAVAAGGPSFVRSKSEEDSLRLLLENGVDFMLMDELVVQYIVRNYAAEAKARLQIGTTPLVTRPLYLAVRRSRPDAESIVTRFNTQLRGLIADRTYHRLLHVDWIKADVDGDGILEYVPRSDQVGTSAPQSAYAIISDDKVTKPGTAPRFYVGKRVYNAWNAIPDVYKVSDTGRPESDRSTLTYFKFSWK